VSLTLKIDVAAGVDPDRVIEDINILALCRLEDDDKTITGWEWIID
jgi:hypothetical protein